MSGVRRSPSPEMTSGSFPKIQKIHESTAKPEFPSLEEVTRTSSPCQNSQSETNACDSDLTSLDIQEILEEQEENSQEGAADVSIDLIDSDEVDEGEPEPMTLVLTPGIPGIHQNFPDSEENHPPTEFLGINFSAESKNEEFEKRIRGEVEEWKRIGENALEEIRKLSEEIQYLQNEAELRKKNPEIPEIPEEEIRKLTEENENLKKDLKMEKWSEKKCRRKLKNSEMMRKNSENG